MPKILYNIKMMPSIFKNKKTDSVQESVFLTAILFCRLSYHHLKASQFRQIFKHKQRIAHVNFTIGIVVQRH